VADQKKFGQMPDAGRGTGPGKLRCDDWEAMLTDALDGQLAARERAAFDTHAAGCAGCADLLAHAKQGQEWLGFLHSEPEIPAGLVSKILDKTTGAGAIPIPVIADGAQGTGVAAAAIPWRRSFHETRLLMTVAMAFFSFSLMLNMAGVKLTSLRLADLRPATIGNTLSRQFYATRAQISKFYNNAWLVYQLESKMRELRRDNETPQTTPKKAEPSSRNSAEPGSGLRAESSEEPAGSRQGALGVLRFALRIQGKTASGQPSAVSEERALENRQPQAVDTHLELRGTGDHKQHRTEVQELNLLHNVKAGPRRIAATAGCDGRSLA
jgi:hypothetical protein